MKSTERRIIRNLDLDKFPSELRKRRNRLGLTQSQLGEAIGFHSTVISQWECELRQIPDPQLVHVALRGLELTDPEELAVQLLRRG